MSTRVAPWIVFAGCIGSGGGPTDPDPGTETTPTTTTPTTATDPLACADHVLGTGPVRVVGSTDGLGDDVTASCDDDGPQALEDESWAFTAPATGAFTFSTINGMSKPNIVVLDGCGGVELACGFDHYSRPEVTVDLVAGQTVIVVVDGGSDYALDVFPVAPIEFDCDNQRDDDGNRRVDCEDPACVADADCAPTCPDVYGELGVTLRASTVGEPDHWRAKCNYYGPDSDSDTTVGFFAQQAGSYGLQVVGLSYWTYTLDGCDGVEQRFCIDHYEDEGLVRLELVGGQEVVVVAENGYRGEPGVFDVDFYPIEGYESSCTDGVDNDHVDGADCRDPACEYDPSCAEDCTHGYEGPDQDRDGVYGCSDPWCDGDPACDEDCTNGIDDNDGYGTDCGDPSCDGHPSCVEDCTNGVDDDGDYRIDCMDGGCAATCVAVCPDQVLTAPGQVALSPVGATDEVTASCVYGGPYADESVAFTAPATARYRFAGLTSVGTSPVVVTDGCGGAELACGNNAGVGIDLAAGQTVVAHVEAQDTYRTGFALDVIEVPGVETVCTDGLDDDADGGTDCDDPDCGADPVCAEDCADDSDDDYDWYVDCTDPDCVGSPSCPVPTCPENVLSGPLPIQALGSMRGQIADRSATCSNGGIGPDVTWSFVAPADGTYTFDTEGTVSTDTLLSVLDGCEGAALACNDDESPSGDLWSIVTVDLVAGQEVIVVVDSWWPWEDGEYVLNVR